MNTTQIIMVVTMFVTWILGILSKKCKFINNNLIPIQNVIIGFIVSLIEWAITGDFNSAITISGLLAGGTYDIFNNTKKIINKGEK